MMNPSVGPHHKIWTAGSSGVRTPVSYLGSQRRRSQAGYTLVALLAIMTVLALFAMAAAPNLYQQAQRDREIEAIYRGEQLAEAIRIYYSVQQRKFGSGDAALPNSIDQLLEGIPSGTKKVRILRASAARDPLSDSGEWRLIKPRSAQLSDFTRALMVYTENIRPPTNDPQLKEVEQVMAPPVLATLGLSQSITSSSDDESTSGPTIGVSSRSKRMAVIYYYGIDRHDQWVFTPLFR
jgi:type II secretory pathway pseudopilin PulG